MPLSPPQGRPGIPPLDKPPPENVNPHAPSSQCDEPTGMSYDEFWGAVRETIRREGIRRAWGTKNVDKSYQLPTLFEKSVDTLIAAFKEGKHVPGLAERSDNSGKCIMNWYALACFARWYVSEDLSGEKRDYVLQQLRDGVTAEELIDDEAIGVNWYFCEGEVGEDVKQYCCPAELLDDWYYQQLTQGIVPQKSSDGPSWAGVLLLGVGVFAVAMTIRAVSQHAGTNPSAKVTLPPPSAGKTRSERDAIRSRALRSHAATRHSFEEWDELREYIGRAKPSHVSDAAEDLHELIGNLNAIGTKTSESREIEWMLNMSAGVS